MFSIEDRCQMARIYLNKYDNFTECFYILKLKTVLSPASEAYQIYVTPL